MLYAQIVFGLPLEGPFDYIVPEGLRGRIRQGMRVRVPFGPANRIGYVVGLSGKSSIASLKSIQRLLDDQPAIDKKMLKFSRQVSERFCCSWGEAIETALPESIRRGRRIEHIPGEVSDGAGRTPQSVLSKPLLIHDPGGEQRWDIYAREIRAALDARTKVIMLVPDIAALDRAEHFIKLSFSGVAYAVMRRRDTADTPSWEKIKRQQADIAVGTRSCIFAPFQRTGLIIIDEENDPSYKQEQVPHYHARDAAFMRSSLEKSRLLLSSRAPSLECMRLVRKGKIEYHLCVSGAKPAEVKIMDAGAGSPRGTVKPAFIPGYLQAMIGQTINASGRVLIFLNRKGFATHCSCASCAAVLKCPRCSINLVYHFANRALKCHYCNFFMQVPQICPACNAGYIRLAGAGTEKIESELARVFPHARIAMHDGSDKTAVTNADILIATESVARQAGGRFELVVVYSVDNLLNRIDFRASERVFYLLTSLSAMAEKTLLVQTRIPRHYVFEAIAKAESALFYDKELKQRKQLKFPPFRHFALIRVRGRQESRVRDAASALGKLLSNALGSRKDIRVVSVNPGDPARLRGNFYWQVLLSAQNALILSRFLKLHLRKFRSSGIIVTVDVDPQ